MTEGALIGLIRQVHHLIRGKNAPSDAVIATMDETGRHE
jgi:hypothetical protein